MYQRLEELLQPTGGTSQATKVTMIPDKRTLLCFTMGLWELEHFRSLGRFGE